MIDLKHQWCIQIDVTNACTRKCSNCTRFVGLTDKPFFMSVDCYEKAVYALADFPSESPKALDPMFARLEHKVVGMIGGEPLLHPNFEELCCILECAIPERVHRGLWTGLVWQSTAYADTIRRVFGYINNNMHMKSHHSPVLTAIEEYVEDREERDRLIDNCWLQRLWSGTITPKGLFFCEVAGAMDLLFDGPGGLPVEKGCWRKPISDFRQQIERWCPKCGIPLQLPGRLDRDQLDDVSPRNLLLLKDKNRCVVLEQLSKEAIEQPWRYM